SPILKIEVAIKLFELYKQENRVDLAVEMIKQAVEIDPDYRNVTDKAREYFEKQRDFSNALELAVNEAIRTELPQWIHTIIEYVKDGKTKGVKPEYFTNCITVVMNIDGHLFEKMAAALWNSYKMEEN